MKALGNLLCCDWNTNVKLNLINMNACNRSEIDELKHPKFCKNGSFYLLIRHQSIFTYIDVFADVAWSKKHQYCNNTNWLNQLTIKLFHLNAIISLNCICKRYVNFFVVVVVVVVLVFHISTKENDSIFVCRCQKQVNHGFSSIM